MELLQDMII